MSSIKYSTELTPEPILRRVVIISGLVASTLGLATILLLPVAVLWRAVVSVIWLGVNGRELVLIAKGHKRCSRYRIQHDGDVYVQSQNGAWSLAKLAAGSVVLSRWAWLRIEFDDGRRGAELVRSRTPQNEQWRRLQVIWRHL